MRVEGRRELLQKLGGRLPMRVTDDQRFVHWISCIHKRELFQKFFE